MKLVRSVAIAIAMYFSTTLIAIISAHVLRSKLRDTFSQSVTYWLFTVLCTILIVMLFTSLYFRDTSITVHWKEGLQFATISIILILVLDVTFTISTYISQTNTVSFLAYYMSPLLWLTGLVIILTPTVMAHIMRES